LNKLFHFLSSATGCAMTSMARSGHCRSQSPHLVQRPSISLRPSALICNAC
jgi:hypothetical protein